MKISALIIAKNEEAVIERCLNSLMEFDEVILVDTGSKDTTPHLAGLFSNVRVFHDPWKDDFSAARNFALDQATGDWCMQIDADHVLKTEADAIRGLCALAEREGHDVLSIQLTHEGSGHQHRGAWLFKRTPDVRWVGRIHEVLNKAATIETNVEQVYSKSPAHEQDPDRNLRILLKSDPREARTCFYLGREYADRNAPKEACEWMNKYLQIGLWEPEICEAHLTLARSYWMLQNGALARKHCLEAIRNNPMFKEALLFMSELHYEPWKSRWQTLASAATNEGVLFVRT